MKKMIITPTNKQEIDMSQEEIDQRLSEIENAKQKDKEKKEKEKQKKDILDRLKLSNNQEILDLLELLGF